MLLLFLVAPLKGLIAPNSNRIGFRLRRWVRLVTRRLDVDRARVLAVRLTVRLTVLRLVRAFFTNCPDRLRTILGLARRRRFTFRLGFATRVTLVAVAIG